MNQIAPSPRQSKKWVDGLLAWVIVGMILFQAVQGLLTVATRTSPFYNSAVTYADLLQSDSRISYDLVQFVQNQTPENAVLLLSPQWYPPHAVYFFFPRKLIIGGAEQLRAHPEITHVVISDGYPDFPVNGEKIILNNERGVYKLAR